MRIALVQINPVIGDFESNCEKILLYTHKAYEGGCNLVVFPELVISGYPPQDLLERRSFISDYHQAEENLFRKLPDLDVMLGTIESHDVKGGKPLYNSAIVVRNGAVVFKARKQLLPSYDVFDETRYFEPGPPSDLYEIDGQYFGVTICEDVWHNEIRDYDIAPVEELHKYAASSGKQLAAMINISASPFQREKEDVRRSIFTAYCKQFQTPFIYCNQVGGQDSLIFDGRSLAMNKDGEIVAQAEGFAEDMIVVDTSNWKGDIHAPLDPPSVQAVYDALVMGVRDHVTKCGFSSAVIGLSGGIDSALTAAIAVDALGADNVLGVAMPSPYSSEDSLEDAEQLAKNLKCKFEIIAIAPLFDQFKSSLGGLFAGREEDLTEQNLQARIRGNLLMAISNKFGHLLLTTGNKSEMAVGYCTLYGDMSGGLAVISDVPKQLVYELSCYANRKVEKIPERTITKPPSAELKPDQLDQDDLPPYEVLDKILHMYLEQGIGVAEIINSGFSESVVKDIIRRVQVNEYKRKQAPLGLKVTTKAFGCGRRYPTTHRYKG